MLALVGPSGGGKSSIIRLLQRYYVPEQGVVLLDGRDVGTYNPHWLRRRMAIVAQVYTPKMIPAVSSSVEVAALQSRFPSLRSSTNAAQTCLMYKTTLLLQARRNASPIHEPCKAVDF